MRSLVRLVCLPHAGAGGSVYRPWISALAPSIEVVPITYPGRESRQAERPFAQIGELSAWVAAQIASMGTAVPIALFGHSLGAVVAFETVRTLRHLGVRAPVHLFVAGRQAPHLPLNRVPIHQLPDAEFLDAVARLGGTPHAVLSEPSLFSIFAPVLRADLAAVETYRCAADEPLECPITVLGGSNDVFGNDELDAWRRHTTSGCTVSLFPGDHFFVVSARDRVCAAVSAALDATPRLYNSGVLETAS